MSTAKPFSFSGYHHQPWIGIGTWKLAKRQMKRWGQPKQTGPADLSPRELHNPGRQRKLSTEFQS
jgi:hypothetical protein